MAAVRLAGLASRLSTPQLMGLAAAAVRPLSTRSVPLVFNRDTKRQHRNRAAAADPATLESVEYLRDEVAARVADRLLVWRRTRQPPDPVGLLTTGYRRPCWSRPPRTLHGGSRYCWTSGAATATSPNTSRRSRRTWSSSASSQVRGRAK